MASCPYIRAHWRHLANTIEHVHPSTHLSPQSSDTVNGSVRPFLHSLRQKVPILYNGRPYPPELTLPIGDLDLSCNTWCFQPIRVHNPSGTSIGPVVFAQMTAECLNILQWFAFFPSKLPLPMLASGPHLICSSLGPPESGKQMELDRFGRFCRADRLTEWQDDWQTTLLSAMWRNNA